jgi:hypothetical protein
VSSVSEKGFLSCINKYHFNIRKTMRSRIWVSSFFLAFSWLISPAIAGVPVNIPETWASNTTKSSPATTAKHITVTKAEFGVLRQEKGGKVTLIPTKKVPLLEGVKYGWRLHLKDYKGEVTWREVLQLPEPPETWGTTNTENFSLSADGTAAQTKRKDSAKDGVIKNSWTIAPGDPLGKHTIEVYIGYRHVATFNFEVVPPKREKPATNT